MGKANAVSKRRRKAKAHKFVHKSVLRKRNAKRLNKFKIECQSIKKAWNSGISVDSNLKLMGLSNDPNLAADHMSADMSTTAPVVRSRETRVVDELQQMADKPQSKNFRLSVNAIQFCVYMIEKYGDDYKAMVRDKKNYYQESKGQIKRKIKIFKSIPSHFNAYLKAKQMCENNLEDISETIETI